MLTFSEVQHPRPKGEKPFQEICLKLLQHEWDDPYAKLHARKGQRQHGADITGEDKRGGYINAACQCKGSDTNEFRQLSIKELEEEVELAKTFNPPLDIFIVAYMGKPDGPLDRKAIEITKAHTAVGLFRVEVWSWAEIVDRAKSYPEVRKAIYIQDEYILPTTLDPKRPAGNLADHLGEFRKFTDRMESRLPDESSSAPPVDVASEAKIDAWRDQIRAGSGQFVIDPLRAFVDGLGPDANPHVKFRAHANLGAALAQAGKFERAAVEFEEAAKAEPGTAASHAYRARAMLTRGRHEDAVKESEKALELDSKQVLAAAVLIETSSYAPGELERRLADVMSQPDVAGTLSMRYSELGQHADALRVARGIEVTDTAIPRDAAVAMAIVARFESNMQARIGAAVPPEEAELLDEAQTLLEKCWAWAKQRPDKTGWVFVAGNLTSIYRLSGEHEKANELALEAYAISPDFQPVAERAVLALLHRNRHGDALKAAEKLAETGAERSALLAADVAMAGADWTSVLKWATKSFEETPTDDDRARAAENIVAATYKLSDPETALSEADRLRPSFAASVGFEGRVAEITRRLGDPEKVKAAEARLNQFDVAKMNPLERFELSAAYADGEDWAKAADLLIGLYATDRASTPLKQRLFALYRGNKRNEGRELYESLAGDALQSAEIHRLGAAIYERSGMLPQALKALEAALHLSPADLRSRLDWARLRIRHNEEGPVAKWIGKTTLDFAAAPEDLMEFAQLLDRYNRRKDALSIAYRTLVENWGRSERLHMTYMGLFLLRSRTEAFLQPKKVAEDSVVFLKDAHGTQSRFLIEAGPKASPGKLLPTHPLAQLLLGKVIGDTAEQDGLGERRIWTITGIKHKFLDLLHRSLEEHESNFPGTRSFGRFHVDVSDHASFEPVFEQARERARLVDEAATIYKDRPVPIDAIAKITGVSAIDAARGLRFRSDVTLDSCQGDHAEREQSLRLIKTVTEFVVDAITLSIWQEIELLNIIEGYAGAKILVVQATIDDLNNRAEEAKMGVDQEGGSLEAHGDRVALIEPTKTQRQENADRCVALLDWVRANAEVVPTETFPTEPDPFIYEILSNASIDTLATVATRDAAAVIEDRRLRMIGASLGVGKATWTQIFIIYLRDSGCLSRKQYVSLTAKLREYRVGFVTVGADDLLVATKSGAADQFSTLVTALAAPTVEPVSLAGVVTTFIATVWRDRQFVESREMISSTLLNVLLSRPDGIELLKLVFAEVDAQIGFARPLWFVYIQGFTKGHFISAAAVRLT